MVKVMDYDALIAAVRADKKVGKGTCSSIDECYEDEELKQEFIRDNITTPEGAVKWAREAEGLFLEQALNCR